MSVSNCVSRTRLLAGVCAAALGAAVPASAAEVLQEVTVTGTREGELRSETPNSISILREGTIEDVKPGHPGDLIQRVPGATVMQTNGEGHTTGIRQPIGTAAVYLYLEDGIPTRSTGFFNHNALYEVNLPQADAVEVIRGPGTALQGSDAIGGVINVLTKPPSATPSAEATAEGGSYGWARMLGTASSTWDDVGARADLNLTHTDGWRDWTGYDRQSGTLRVDSVLPNLSVVKAVLTATNIDQETGATSTLSRADYENDPTRNYTPIAFRKVQAVRASLEWEQEDENSLVSVTPYVRWNTMELLPSWQLTYDPVVYESGHSSFGLLSRYRHDFEPLRTRVVTGLDLDYSPGFRDEWSISTTKSDRTFTSWARGAKIYDYDVTFSQASPYVHAEASPVSDLRVTGGLRLDLLSYDYENNMSVLQTGTKRRPASDTRYYTHLSPSLGGTYAFAPSFNGFVNYKHSFRAPSESQLFRQGGDTNTVNLRPVKVDSYEIGFRGPDRGDVTWEVSAYHMIKRNDILTIRDGTNNASTNNGRTHHDGVEAAVGWRFLPEWRLGASGSYSEHKYEKWVARSGTVNVDYSGNEISTAPSTVANLTLAWMPAQVAGLTLEAEWSHLGSYQMDEANTAEYGGHDLFNLRGAYAVNDSLELFARLMNVFDRRWATQAQVSSNERVYAPGMPRTVYAGVTARF